MTGETKYGRTQSAIAIGAFLIAIAVGLLVGYFKDDYLTAVWVVLIIFGIYMVFASKFRSNNNDSFGPSEADAAAAGGIIMAGIGAAGMVYTFTEEVIFTAVVLLVVFAVTGIVMAYKNRGI